MEFVNVGARCSEPSCRLQDFLPFTCDCCSKVYCLSHRTYKSHACPSSGTKDSRSITCPLCARGVKLVAGESPDVTWNRHSNSSACDPSKRKQRVHKKRCAAKGCHEKLVFSNRFTCEVCHKKVCMKHRFADAHQCKPPAPPKRPGLLSRLTGRTSATNTKAAAKPAATRRPARVSRTAADPGNTLRGSAARRGAPAPAPAPAPAAALPTPSSAGREVCPTCQARFTAVTELVAHVEGAHGSGGGHSSAASTRGTAAAVAAAGGGAGGGAGVHGDAVPCPHCGTRFVDYARLVEHVEAHRAAAASRANSGGGSSCVVS